MATSKKRSPKNAKLGREVAERIADAARQKGLSLTQLALRIGAPTSQVSAWRNDGALPGGYYLIQLSKALGVTTDWLLGIEGAPKFRGLKMDPGEMRSQIVNEVMQAMASGLPRLMPEALETMWRPIEEAMRRNLGEQWSDPDKVMRELYGTEPRSTDERRCFFTAMLAVDFLDRRRRTRSELAGAPAGRGDISEEPAGQIASPGPGPVRSAGAP